MPFTHRRLTTAAATVGLCALGTLALSSPAEAARPTTVKVQLLSFNDFHGNLDTPEGSNGTLITGHSLDSQGQPVDISASVGGVEYLATHLEQARAESGHDGSLTVAAGDLIGASPLISAAFHDEPTIEAMNKLGLEVSAVGNHEFDEGYKELLRMQNGGCIADGDGQNNQNSCPLHKFEGAKFQYLAANVDYAGTNRTILPAYTVEKVHGAKIGFIGMTLKDTPSIVTAAGVAGLDFKDEIATANRYAKVLQRQGVNAIIVLIHQGGTPGQQTWYGPDNKPYQVKPSYDAACAKGSQLDPASPILPIAKGLDPSIDMVISGHTHQPYVCTVQDPDGQPRLLTSASSFGRLFTETNLVYDTRAEDIVRASVTGTNVLVTRNVAPDSRETRLVGKYKNAVKDIAGKELGTITADVTRAANPAGESALGDLIADGQLTDPSVVTGGKTPVIAFMNPGGIRADLTYAASSKYDGDANGKVLYGEAFDVQPFSNYMVSMDLTGADLYALLTQQVTGGNSGTSATSSKKTLQVSKGFAYTLTPTGPVDGSVSLNGTPIDKGATYRIVTNNFLAGGGDNFPQFTKGTNVYFGGNDLDAFARYLPTVSPYTPAAPTRIAGRNAGTDN